MGGEGSKGQGKVVKGQGQEVKGQGQAVKGQGQAVKGQGQAVERSRKGGERVLYPEEVREDVVEVARAVLAVAVDVDVLRKLFARMAGGKTRAAAPRLSCAREAGFCGAERHLCDKRELFD